MLVLCAFVFAACNSKDDPEPTGTPATDEQYLKAICTGLVNFSDALVSKTSSTEIAAVIKAYIVGMQQIQPPTDLQKFHKDFVKYLQDALNDPTSLVTTTPPLPSDDVRKRIASKERNVPECRDATFFSTKANPR